MNAQTVDTDYSRVSFWFDSLPEPVRAREVCEFDPEVDVAIGTAGGYVGDRVAASNLAA